MTKTLKPEAFGLQRSAELLDVSVSTLRRWIKEGHLRAFKVGPKLWHVPLEELRRLKKR